MSTSITIGSINIHQDQNGRYSLNDLYRASGGENRHRPSLFLNNKQAKELVELLAGAEFRPRKLQYQAGIPAWLAPIKTDKPETGKPATFVVKELVYAYAMWISPEFNLKVIRAYDALMSGEIAKAKEKQNDAAVKQWKTERAYFEKYPRDKEILRCVLMGEPYWLIATRVRCHVSTIGNAVKRLLHWGLIEANRLKNARSGTSKAYQNLKRLYQQRELVF